MKSEFIQPKLDGARFTEHTLPLDVARDLAAYETLLVELAKHLYLRDHPERQRVPKGFGADFHLHLERVDEGSSRPMLSIVTAGALALDAGANVYFERSRDLITQCIASADGQLPESFPRELLVYFNQVGRSLGEGERMELPGPDGVIATLTPQRRKTLVLAADSVYERPIELNGIIVAVNWEKSSLQLRLVGGVLATVPMPSSFHARAGLHGGKVRDQVLVKGVGAFDSWDQLQKVVAVESLEVQPDYQMANRLDELHALKDGWFEGTGVAPDKSKLEALAEKLIGHYPERLALPAIIPTPEGNLLLEWTAAGEPSVDLELSSMTAEFHAFHPTNGDIEHTFDLSNAEEWEKMYSILNQHIAEPPA